MVDHSKEWDYSESYLWGNNYPQCNSLIQSPIDIDTEQVKTCTSLCNIIPRIKPSKCFVNYKNRTISIKYETGSYTEFENTLYELKEITIHTPSMHSIDGQKFDMEVCMIHKLTDNSSDTAGLNLCCMFDSGAHHGNPERFISQIINDIPSEEIDYDKEINVSEDWSAKWLIPEKSGYYSYNGSLPYPPCTQIYKTYVFEKIGKIGKINIETLKRYLGNVSRNIKSLNGRSVFYTPFLKNTASEKKLFKSSNKYLKCYKDNVTRLQNNKTSDNVTDSNDSSSQTNKPSEGVTNLSVGFSTSAKNRINNIALSIIVLLIFVNAFYFTKYLFKHFYVQKFIRLIAGRTKITFEVVKSWKICQGKILTPADKQAMAEAAKKAEMAVSAATMGSGMPGQAMVPPGGMGARPITGTSGRR